MSSQHNSEESKTDSESITRFQLDPPTNERRSVPNPIKLVFEVFFFIIMIVPLIIHFLIVNFILSPPKSVKDKVIVVTGSGRGLGRGLAERFVQLGCRVACVDIDENLNNETVKNINDMYPGRARAYRCNVAKMDDIKKLRVDVKRDFGHVDILIHNAGLIACSKLVDQEEDFIINVVGVNLTSHFFMIRQFLPDMIERNEGHIVAISSIAGLSAASKCSLYVATKSGVIGLIDCLYHELREIPHNAVKTSTICPWFINTSAHYTKQWNLRIPELSIDEAVEACVDGIRREKRLISIPQYFCFTASLLKLMPDSVNNWLHEIFYVRLKLPPKEVVQNTPVFKLLSQNNDTLKKTIPTNG